MCKGKKQKEKLEMEKKKRIAHTAIMLQSETQLSPHYEIKEASTSTAAPPQNCSLPFTVFAGQKSTDYTHTYIKTCMCVHVEKIQIPKRQQAKNEL